MLKNPDVFNMCMKSQTTVKPVRFFNKSIFYKLCFICIRRRDIPLSLESKLKVYFYCGDSETLFIAAASCFLGQ